MARPPLRLLPSDEEVVGDKSAERLAWESALYPSRELKPPQGEGWKTVEQIAADHGRSKVRMDMTCRAALKANPPRMERFCGRNPSGHQLFYYRPIVKK